MFENMGGGMSKIKKDFLIKTLPAILLTCWTAAFVYVTQFMFLRVEQASMNIRPLLPIIRAIKTGSTESFLFQQILLNVLMFVPLGILLPIFLKKTKGVLSAVYVFFISLILSVSTELVQYFTGRSADVDDVLANTTGGITGFIFYMIIRRLYKKISNRKEPKNQV